MCFPQTHVGGSQKGISTPSAPRRIYSHKQAVRERGMTIHSTALNRSVVGWRFYKCNWIEILIPRNREAHKAWTGRYFCSSIWFQIFCVFSKKPEAQPLWAQREINEMSFRKPKPDYFEARSVLTTMLWKLQNHDSNKDYRRGRKGRQSNDSLQRFPNPTPHDVRLHPVTWQRGIRVADGIKTANQGNLRWEDCLGFSGWAQCNCRGLRVEEEDRKETEIMWEGCFCQCWFVGWWRGHELRSAGRL